MAGELTYYEAWDLTFPLVSERSHLYHIAPIGIGTPTVESLISYATRLSDSHGIPLGRLISTQLVPFVQRHLLCSTSSKILPHRLLELDLERLKYFKASFQAGVWLNQTHEKLRLVTILEALTLQSHLRALTVVPWGKLIAPGFLRDTKAWCPSCFQQWKEKRRPIYEPLLWSLDPISVCLQHKHSLFWNCPRCQHAQPALMKDARVGYCSYCGSWLGLPAEEVKNSKVGQQQLDLQLWFVNTLGELLAVALHRRVKSQLFLEKYLSRLNQTEQYDLARFMNFRRQPLEKLQTLLKSKLALSDLLKLSYYIQVPLVKLLTTSGASS